MDHHQQAAGYNWPMWTNTTSSTSKRRHEYSTSKAYDSWEEKAFAEDAAGLLGSSGCVWPPRSYTCTFCRREFRSAQALGGHMNVHRRDRAQLKQLPNTPQDDQTAPINPNYTINDGGGSGSDSHRLLKPALFMNSDPNHKIYPNPNSFYSSSSSSSTPLPTFSYVPPQDKSSTFGVRRPMSSTSLLVGDTREMQISSNAIPTPLTTWSSKPSSAANFHQRSHRDGKTEAKIISVECEEENESNINNCVKSELSISLSLVVRRNLPLEEAKASCCKRRKVEITSPRPSPPLILISSEASSTGIDKKSKIENAPREVHGFTNSSSLKDIDLELRLGG